MESKFTVVPGNDKHTIRKSTYWIRTPTESIPPYPHFRHSLHHREWVITSNWWNGPASQVRTDKRGATPKQTPSLLKHLHITDKRWSTQVKGIGSSYWRAVGDVDDLLETAKRLNQRWLKGIGTAMMMAKIK